MPLIPRFACIAAVLGMLMLPLNAAVTLDVDVQTTPSPQVTMSWNGQGGNDVEIVRRDLGQSGMATWTTLATNPSSPFTDTTVVEGGAYEYSLRSTNPAARQYNPSNRLAHFVATINAPLNDERGAVLLVVEETWAEELAEELKLLELNLAGDGWVVERIDWNREGQNNGADLKAAIQAQVTANPDINSLFIFGAVEMVKSGYLAPDGHARHSHETDLFYADLDGQWDDDRTGSSYTPGDGIYDESYFPSEIDLRTGRVTFHGMSAFKKNEVEYLRDYIHKEHAYRNRHRDVTYQNYVGDEYYLFASNASLKPMVDNWTSGGNLNTIIGEESYLVAFGNRTSSWDAARDGFQKAIFTSCFRSHIQEWWSSNNNMRGMLTQPDWGLTAVWGGRPAWYFHKLAAGLPIGQSVIDTQNDVYKSGYLYDYDNQIYIQNRDYEFFSDESPFDYVSTNLMGDPTVRVAHVEPVGNLTITRLDTDNVQLNWTASPATDLVGYHVYSSADRLGPYTRLTATPISATSFDAAASTGSDMWFQVRAVADVTVPTGVYEDQSHGRFALAYADGSVNTPPTTSDFTVSGKINTPLAIAFPGSDVDGDTLTPIIVDNPDDGQIRWWEGRPFYVSKRDTPVTETATFVMFDGVTVSEPATVTFIASEMGDTLLGWEFPDGTSTAQSPSYSNPLIASTTISGGPGTDILSAWPGTDSYTTRSIGSSLDPSSNYFQWTVTPDSGYRMNISRINLGICGNNGDSISYELRVSDDGFTTHEVVPMELGNVDGRGYGGNAGTLDSADASGVSVLQDQGSPVEFRLHWWHTGGNSVVGLGKITDPVYYDAIEDVSILGSMTTDTGAPVIQLTSTEVTVPEEDSASINVSLSAPPASPVTLNINKVSGDADLSLGSSSTLQFDSANWNQPQTIVFNAAYDADTDNSPAVFEISGTGLTTVVINVAELDAAQPPVAVADTYQVSVDTLLSVSAPGVLDNDTDANEEPLLTELLSEPSNGDLTLNADGSFTFMPDSGFSGSDSFTYRAFDGVLYSDPATVTLGVVSTTIQVSVFGNVSHYTPEDYDPGQVDNATTEIIGARQIEITGNGWIMIDLTSVDIAADTRLSLDFSNSVEGEIHGVGFDIDDSVNPDSCFQFAGSQDWGDQNLNDYDPERPTVKHYDIPVGQYYTGTYRYLYLVHDDDANIGAVATFANLRIYTPSAATTWADAMGIDVFENSEMGDDANGDGKPNAYHFGLASNPISANRKQGERQITTTEEIASEEYLTITAPFRLGANFSGTPLTSAPVDGIVYTIIGDSDMVAPLGDLNVVEVTPAMDAGLPALDDLDSTPGADWEYRTFRLTTPLGEDAPGFLWIDVSEAP